jgi:ribosomal protein S12 methylthiotransferase accessory factor
MQLPRVANTPLSPHLDLLWVEGHDLVSGAGVWVPYEAVHINSTQQGRVNAGMLCCSSNGLASGNHLLEAASHGICEIVERDAMTLWGARGSSVLEDTRVNLASIDDERCREVLDKFERAGLAVAVWEITSDIGIPAFTCLIAERSEEALRSLHSAAGQGCHPTRGIALLRALTEAAQTRLTIIAGSRDDVLRVEYDRHRNPDQLRHTRHLLGAAVGQRSFHAAPDFQADTFEADVRWELERLRQAGVEHVVVCDLSKRALGIPVVKVVIPGLEGYNSFPNYLPGARAQALRAA